MASPELEMVVTMLRTRPRPEQLDAARMRAELEMMASGMVLPEDVAFTPIDAGGVAAEWVTAPGAVHERAILYLHGGGYIEGSIATHRDLAARLSRATGARVLLIAYRLAPEHPHPAAVEDATAAYRWLLAGGLAPTRLTIGGDSAGGGLTVATLVALRDAGTPLPAAGVCISPWVDLETLGESVHTKADVDPMLDQRTLLQMAAWYLNGRDPRTPLAAPLHADLRGLPPLLIQVGAAEVLLDDATRLAARARAAGVEVTLDVWEEMIHVFPAFAAVLPEAREAIARIGTFVRAKTVDVEARPA